MEFEPCCVGERNRIVAGPDVLVNVMSSSLPNNCSFFFLRQPGHPTSDCALLTKSGLILAAAHAVIKSGATQAVGCCSMPLANSADHCGEFSEGVFGKATLDLTVTHPYSSRTS